MQKPGGKAQDLYFAGMWRRARSHGYVAALVMSVCVRHQACRGDKHDEPVTAAAFDDVDNESKKNEVEVDACAVHTLPAGADFIMCYSVAQGENA